jgi:hypothetical protein
VISATYGRKGLGDLQRTVVHSCNTMHYVSLLLQLVPPSNLTSGDDLFGLSIPCQLELPTCSTSPACANDSDLDYTPQGRQT